MRITAIMTAYNEITFMPIKWEWCKKHNLELYVIDNMSTDGTWEWLQANGIPSHRFDTNGAFHLEWLQQEIIRTIHTIKPDWVIYHGADLFFQTPEGIRITIEKADARGYNLIAMECLTFYNTGEARQNPITSFKYFASQGNLVMIHKYGDDVRYLADDVRFTSTKNKCCIVEGCMINFGQTKTAEERESTLQRRKRAWELGLNASYGHHYVGGSKKKWLWDKKELTHISMSSHYGSYESIL